MRLHIVIAYYIITVHTAIIYLCTQGIGCTCMFLSCYYKDLGPLAMFINITIRFTGALKTIDACKCIKEIIIHLLSDRRSKVRMLAVYI